MDACRACRFYYIMDYLRCRFKLAKESHVVLGEKSKVVYTIFQVCYAFNSHSESVSGVYVGVNATNGKVVRVGHSAAQNFNPSGVFAESASFTSAYIAADIELGAWFGEGEIAWA